MIPPQIAKLCAGLAAWGLLSGCGAAVVSGAVEDDPSTTVMTLAPLTEPAVSGLPVAPPTSTVPEGTVIGPVPSAGDDDEADGSGDATEAIAAPFVAVGTRSGPETARIQERLVELGFWVGRTDGRYDLTTRQAVMAVQKYADLRTSAAVDDATAAWLTAFTGRPTGRADAGTLLEVDKTRQLAFFVVEGRVEWVLNISTGTEVPYERPNAQNPDIVERGTSVTPTGLHRVNRQRAEGWWDGDLGKIYRPKYFVGGVAVHGANSVPDYPASSGCVRVSVPAMDWIWETGILPMNSPVWVHGEIPRR